MCTLIVLDRLIPGYPVVAAANRDEFHARPASGPRQLGADPWVIAPRDEKAGGTWIGVSEGGFFAGLTNRPGGKEPDPSRRSRGEVTMRALQLGSAERAIREIGGLPRDRYNGFNLLCAGPDGAAIVTNGEPEGTRRLAPGLHILTNGGLNLPGDPKVSRIRGLLGDPASLETVAAALTALEGALGDHAGAAILERVCIHSNIYGTRSATLLALHGEDPGRSIYRHTEGPPCETPWKDASDLFKTMPLARAGGGVG